MKKPCLVKIAPEDTRVIQTLLGAVSGSHKNKDLRNRAVALIEDQKLDANLTVVPLVLGLRAASAGPLDGGDNDTFDSIVKLLSKYVPENEKANKELLAVVAGDGYNFFSRRKAIALVLEADLDSGRVVTALISALKTSFVRLEAINALGKMGPAAMEAVPALKKLKLDSSGEVREAAASALSKIQKE